MAGIGMAVPGATDIGLGMGLDIGNQVAGETDEERKKRLLAQQQNRLLPSATAGVSSLGMLSTGYSVAGGLGR
jgi:hypothetical protein